ncbi:MAG: YIP1 family protein [Candidatus Neomarinimicrobiota bacterium]
MVFVKRMFNVFFAPAEAFADLAGERDWKNIWIPLIILALVGMISTAILRDLTVDFQLERIEKMIANNERIPEERKEAVLEQQYQRITDPGPVAQIMTWGAALLVTPLRVAFMALIALLVGNFIMGGDARYGQLLALSGYVYLLTILELIVKIPLMLSKWDMEVYTGLGLLGIGEFGDFSFHFLAGLDIFAFWRIILIAIGMGIIYRKGTRPFLIAMTIVWLVLVAVNAGLGAAFS